MLISSIVPETVYQLNFISFFIKAPISVCKSSTIRNNQKHLNFFHYKLTCPRKHKTLMTYLRKNRKFLPLLIYTIFLLFNGIHAASLSHVDINVKISSTIFSIIFPIAVFFVIIPWFYNPSDFVRLLNMFLVYESNSDVAKSDSVKFWKTILKYFLWIFGFGFSLIAPLGMGCLNVIELHRPPFLGSVLPFMEISKISETGILICFLHLFSILFQVWQYYLMFLSYFLIMGNIFVPSILSMGVYLGEILR